MSKVEELRRKINEGNIKLQTHQRDVDYWLKELRHLNEELTQEMKWQQEEAEHASERKAA